MRVESLAVCPAELVARKIVGKVRVGQFLADICRPGSAAGARDGFRRRFDRIIVRPGVHLPTAVRRLAPGWLLVSPPGRCCWCCLHCAVEKEVPPMTDHRDTQYTPGIRTTPRMIGRVALSLRAGAVGGGLCRMSGCRGHAVWRRNGRLSGWWGERVCAPGSGAGSGAGSGCAAAGGWMTGFPQASQNLAVVWIAALRRNFANSTLIAHLRFLGLGISYFSASKRPTAGELLVGAAPRRLGYDSIYCKQNLSGSMMVFVLIALLLNNRPWRLAQVETMLKS